MNRAFLIIIAPAILVGALSVAMNYGKVVPRWVAFSVAGVAAVALLWQVVKSRSANTPRQ
jgi:membrane protein implicated in regulation of membrane protease activity